MTNDSVTLEWEGGAGDIVISSADSVLPTADSKNAEIKAYLDEQKISYSSGLKKSELLKLAGVEP